MISFEKRDLLSKKFGQPQDPYIAPMSDHIVSIDLRSEVGGTFWKAWNILFFLHLLRPRNR